MLYRVPLLLLVSGSVCFVIAALNAKWTISPAILLSLYLSALLILIGCLLIFVRRSNVILANFVVFILLLLGAEIVCFFILGMPPAFNRNFSPPDFPEDHIYRNVGKLIDRDTNYNHVQKKADKTIFDVHYSIDEHYRRITPEPDNARQEFALFFGCSFAFGYGLEDDETMPYQFQEISNRYRAYNYAYTGHSANHMLARLEFQDLSEQVAEEEGIAIYVFIWDHIDRAVGSMRRYTDWLSNAPYYTFVDGDLVRKKMFNNGRFFLSKIYELIYQSSIVKLFEIDFPFQLNDEHFDLVSEMILKSKEKYIAQFGNDRFYVLIYPSYIDDYTENELRRFKVFLNKKNIETIDFSNLIRFEAGYTIPDDGHPNADTNALIAAELWKEISHQQRALSP